MWVSVVVSLVAVCYTPFTLLCLLAVYRLMQAECDMSHYIWLETTHDVPSADTMGRFTAQDPRSGSKSVADLHSVTGSTLMMKARGYTPAVQRCNLRLHVFKNTRPLSRF